MVSTVPVEGDQVMLNGEPAVTVVRVVNEKGFWAVASVARAVRRSVERYIFAYLLVGKGQKVGRYIKAALFT